MLQPPFDEGEVSTESEFDREIKCPVHGYIPVSKFITLIIDTPQFQRLRNLKQLGTSYFVWPGASHNRFEHSIGVFHLSRMMVNRLRNAQPDLQITDRDVRCVEVAGLCHDLGHGPFSHIWDNRFIPIALPGIKWQHEDASEMMLDYLVGDNNIDLKPDEVEFIKDLIAGSKKHTLTHTPPEKDFLFEIVANKRNGIDVDKFDYIARDTRAVSCGTIADLIRLINSARVIEGQICYSEKNATTVYGLFQERFNLHKTIYHHKTAKSIEFMIVDALIKADPYLKIAERIHDPKRFMHLNDSVVLEVERSECPELSEARQIIHRIRTRDLYKLVDKTFLPWDNHALLRQHFTPARIVAKAKSLDSEEFRAPGVRRLVEELREDHVIVDMAALHHGMGDKFPLSNCKFYGKYRPDVAFPPRREEDISHLLPKEFGEVWHRVFTRESRFFGIIQTASRALHDTIALPVPRPPLSPPPPTSVPFSNTPSAPSTPRATSSFLSDTTIADDTTTTTTATTATVSKVFKTPGPSGSMSSVGGTPHNNFMTVPVAFTPMAPRRWSATRRSKRELEGVEEEEDGQGGEEDDTIATGSPKRKKKRST